MKRKYFLVVFEKSLFCLLIILLSSLLISGCSPSDLIFGPSGSIEVDTYPTGAKIFLNGNDTGHITPYTITNLVKGTYEIKLTLGNISYTKTVIVYSDNISTVYKDLLPRLDKIVVQPPSIDLKEGDFQTINSITAYYFDSSTTVLNPSDCSYSSNSNHATVNSMGTITGVSEGSAIITVSYTEAEITKTDSININVTTIPPPTAVIQVSPDAIGIAPFTVTFDASGSYGHSIVSYSWDFGDGNSSTGITARHIYNDVGIYTVTLTVTDSDGKKGYNTKVIIVNEEPVPEIGNITVSANPESNVPGGKSTITAVVTDTEGDVVPDGTTVYFTTNNGALLADHADTTNGMANVILNLSNMQVNDTATVTAFIGAVSSNTEVSCIAGLITEEITLSANPLSNVPGGKSTISAIVKKKAGGFVDDGTTVYFTTNSGELSASSSNTVDGIATVKLTLNDNMEAGENTEVTAFTLNSGDPEKVTITCIEPIVTIYADDYSISEGGTSNITAVVTKKDGTPVDDVIVIFFAKDKANLENDIGTLTSVYCPTNASGIAATTLTLSTSGDTAIITAKCGSRVSKPIEITCK